MTAFIDFLKNLLPANPTANVEERYLADAVDLADLEQRMRWLERGRRPALND